MHTSLIRPARAAVALLFALGLAGCFDFDEHLTLKGSGGGQLELMLRTDPSLKGAFDDKTLLGQQATPVEVTREVKDGQYIQREKVTFNKLPELRVRNETLSVTNEGATFFGIGPKKLTLRRIIDNGGADPDSFGVMRGVFQDRVYTYAVTLPGWIEKAYPLVVNGEAINPVIDGATVKWQVPMAKAISAKRLDYRVDFRSYMDIDANLTAQRVDGDLDDLPTGQFGGAARH
jgi:hypothetical protein